MITKLRTLTSVATRIYDDYVDSIYQNALFLVLSTVAQAGIGFVFWALATRFYPPNAVGQASAIISSIGLVSLISKFGLEISMTRYLATADDSSRFINTCLTVAVVSSAVIGAGAVVAMSHLQTIDPAEVTVGFALLFVAFSVAETLRSLQTDGVFVGFRNTVLSFVQGLSTVGRVVLLPLLVGFGMFGIFTAFGLATAIAALFGFVLIRWHSSEYRPFVSVDYEVIESIFTYSLGNYVAKISEGFLNLFLPILVVSVLSAEQNAYFFIAWQISILFAAIPKQTAMSLLAESSDDVAKLNENVKKSAIFTFGLLVPGIAFVMLFGQYVLLLFGDQYVANSLDPLKLFVIGGIPFAINSIYASVKRVREQIETVIVIYGTVTVSTLSLSYVLMPEYGIVGAGYGWLIGNGITVALVGCLALGRKMRS